MENNLDPYERWHLEKYMCMPNESNNLLMGEDFENTQINEDRQINEWHNEAPF